MLFIFWCDSCAWLFRLWLVFHIAVTTAELDSALPDCADIYCLVSINIQQESMNVNGCHFLHVEALLHMPFHLQSSQLLICATSKGS